MILPLALAPAVFGAPPPDRLGAGAADREVFKHLAPPDAAAPPPAETGRAWDITRYVLDVRIDPAAETVVGTATISATRLGAGELVLDADGPVVSAVRVDGAPVDAVVTDEQLRLDPSGDSTTVEVDWTFDQVRPTGLSWGRDVVYSFHEPIGARTWLPVYDHPDDKAELEWIVTAPDAWVVAANGALASSTSADGWTTWDYQFDAPIPTYLMTVHLSDYAVIDLPGATPVRLWAYPDRADEMEASFASSPDLIDAFEARFGPYPFASYGVAMSPFATAMEDTTCVSFSDTLVGTDDAELVNAHELAHHWWGDDVTLGDWADIWLNEGFATYGEVLWYEALYGDEGRTAYVAWLRDSFFDWQDLEGRFPVYDPLYMWGGVVYDKGGLVLHMLRGVLGDDAFFAALQDYERSYHLANATTPDLEASLEASTGQDLGWFFDEWVYGIGEPTYTWGWADGERDGGWRLEVEIAQDLMDFRMPVPVEITYADGATEVRSVQVEGERVRAGWDLDREPVGVALDPDGWVLRTGEEQVEIALTPQPEVDAPEACGCRSVESPAMPFLGMLALVRRRRR